MLYALGLLDSVTDNESKEKDGVVKHSFQVQIKGSMRGKACLIDIRIPVEHRAKCEALLGQVVICPVKTWGMDGKSGVSSYDSSNPVPVLFSEFLKTFMQKQK